MGKRKRQPTDHCGFCGGSRHLLFDGAKRQRANPLFDTVFGRHRQKNPADDDRMVTSLTASETLPAPITPKRKASNPLPSSSEGLIHDDKTGAMVTPANKRPRREIAVFHILVTGAEYQNKFRLAIWKIDHGTPIKHARKIFNDAKILKSTEDLVPLTEKRFERRMTKKRLLHALLNADKSRNQGRIMGIRKTISAREASEKAYDIALSPNQIIVEWNHLVAHRFAASESQQPHNLVIATKECNTQMEALESATQQMLQNNIPLTISISANTIEGTHVATSIQYSIRFDNENHVTIQFDPAATERTALSLKQYFYNLLRTVFKNPEKADQIEPKQEPQKGTLRPVGLFKIKQPPLTQRKR